MASIEYNINTPYTITALNAVGPTTDTTIRPNSVLPWPDSRSTGAPDYDTINKDNDINTVYLDPDAGSDANGGTDLSSDAVLTFTGALARVTAARHTIHIEGTVNTATTLAEVLSSSPTTLTADLDNIQVASGQTCEITISGGFYQWGVSPTGKIHGLTTIMVNTESAPWTNGINYEYCKIDAARLAAIIGNGTFTFDNSIAISRTPTSSSAGVIVTTSNDLNMNNSVICNLGIPIPGVQFGQASVGTTIDLTHNVIIGCSDAYIIVPTTTSLTTTNNHSHIIHQCGDVLGIVFDVVSALSTTVTNSLLNVNGGGNAVITSSTNLRDQNPLFLNQADFDFRLAHIGRTVDGVNFPVSSPAIGLGLSDAGAWLHTYVAGSETLTTFSVPSTMGLQSLKLIGERSNYQKFQDIQGRYFNTHDGINYRVEIDLSNKYWTGNPWSYELLNICRSTGPMRYFPGYGIESETGAVVTVDDDTEIDITSLTRVLETNQLVGWVVAISWSSPVGLGYYQVGSNTSGRLSDMVHIRGDTDFSAAGTTGHNVTVDYLPVLLDMPSLQLISEYYSEDMTNDTFKPWHPDQTADHVSEFHSRKIVLRQTEAI